MALGVSIPNTAISRVAVTLTATDRGWDIAAPNRNGVVLHAWAQAPVRAEAQASVHWPLVALRTLPDTKVSEHWVLAESVDLPVNPTGPIVGRGFTQTDLADPPGPLPPAEREALNTVFEDHLSWPPTHPAQPLLLKQAARRLGISISGLQDRLAAARARALRLGHPPPVGLTDPGYLFTLVRAGYLDLPTQHPHAPAPPNSQPGTNM